MSESARAGMDQHERPIELDAELLRGNIVEDAINAVDLDEMIS